MTVENPPLLNFDSMSKQHTRSHQPRRPHSMAEMKVRQATKIREIAEALVDAGFVTLNAQARVLGVGRSTAWTILKSSHKGSGLSAKIINCILANQQLPRPVRARILDYVEDKASGHYGHSAKLRRKFITALSAKLVSETRKGKSPTRPDAKSRQAALPARSHNVVRNSDPVDLDCPPVRARRAI
jgi:hypothetical protein